MESAQDFLGQKRLAVVGVSKEPRDFSRVLFRELRQRGYEAVPVNPGASDIEGDRCFPRVQDIDPPIDNALLMTNPTVTETVVRDCIAAGVKRVWLYRGGGKGSVSKAAVELCEKNGIAVIPGECPFMFFPETGWVHRFHGFIRKIARTYPH
jgi:predicted CoA-binding protein